MAKEKQDRLSDKEREELLKVLEERGKEEWSKRWKKHMAVPTSLDPDSSDLIDREKILRYLLLRVLINQQAKFDKVREISINLAQTFEDQLLFEPYNISESELFQIFKKVAGDKGSLLYKVGKLGGIKPISLFTYRFKAYEGFIKWLNKNNQKFYAIIIEIIQKNDPIVLYEFLNTHPILEAGWVGNDPKACRMLVNWIVFLFDEIWKFKITKIDKTLMIVDGHVCKVFCRSGLLDQVFYEEKRPYIIQASKMRRSIEIIVSTLGKTPFYVDNGAFYLFEDGFCTDDKPNCKDCPISKICKKYTKWTAYQLWKG